MTHLIFVPLLLAQTGQNDAPQAAPNQQPNVAVPISGAFEALVVPPSRPGFGANRWIDLGERKFEVLPDGSIGLVYGAEDGWARVAARAPELVPVTEGVQESRIKVIVLSDSMIVDTGTDGVWRRRRSTMTAPQLSSLKTALAQFYAAVVVASNNQVRPVISLETDAASVVTEVSAGDRVATGYQGKISLNDPTSEADGVLFGKGMIRQTVVPRVNVYPFESDDPTYRGPFDSVIVLHAGLVQGESSYLYGSTPVWSAPYLSYLENANIDLASRLFQVWVQHYGFKKNGVGSLEPPATWSVSPEPNVSSAMAELTADSGLPDWGVLETTGVKNAFLFDRDGETYLAATAAGADLVRQSTKGFELEPVARAWAPVGLVTVYSSTLAGNLADSLGMTVVRPERSPILGVGSHVVTAMPNGHWMIQRSGTNAQGFAYLATPGQEPLFTPGAGRHFGLTLRGKSNDRWAINFHDQNGEIIASATLNGIVPNPLETTRELVQIPTSARLDGSEERIVIDTAQVPGPVYGVSFGLPPFGQEYSRAEGGTHLIEVWNFGPTEDAVTEVTLPVESEAATWLMNLGEIGETLTDEQWNEVRSVLTGRDFELRVSAIGVLRRSRHEGATEVLQNLASSSDDATAYQATQALGHQGTPTALNILRQVMHRGPFDLNRYMAFQALPDKTDVANLGAYQLMLTNRSWRLRQVAADAMASIPGEGMTVTLLGSITDYEPYVRASVVMGANPNSDLAARRLVYAAVNDPSEAVRFAALSRLVDSTIDLRASEAMRGVRDDSIAVRVALLNSMVERANPSYRPAYQMAMGDTHPEVLAAALRGFATLPEGATMAEIEPALNSDDAEVALALMQLAQKTSMSLPAEYLTRMQGHADTRVSGLANELGGGE